MRRDRRQRALRVAVTLATVSALWACGGKKKAPEVTPLLTAEAQFQHGQDQMARGKMAAAADTFSRIHQYAAEDRKEMEPLVRLALADATFYQPSSLTLIDARSLYADFVTLYSDHELAPYAQFQVGVCSLKQVSHPSKDQSQTFRAVDDLREVERLYPRSRYAEAARGLLRQAHSNLAEHEFIVGRFYMKKKAYVAAVDRFRTVLDRYPDYPETEKVYLYLGQTLVRADNAAEGRIYLDKVVADFPESKYVGEARKALSHAANGIETDVARSP